MCSIHVRASVESVSIDTGEMGKHVTRDVLGCVVNVGVEVVESSCRAQGNMVAFGCVIERAVATRTLGCSFSSTSNKSSVNVVCSGCAGNGASLSDWPFDRSPLNNKRYCTAASCHLSGLFGFARRSVGVLLVAGGLVL